MDYIRSSGMQVDGASVLFHQLNHNKELKMVDYNTEKGKAELFDLIKNADALIEQFRPGAMDAWGFGYEKIKKINPAIVYVSLTGYGQKSIYKDEAGHDFNYLAYAGIMSLLKDEYGKPVVPGFQMADISGGYMAVMAMQAALLKKYKTGKGSYVDVNLCDAVLPFLALSHAFQSMGLDHEQFNFINGKTAVNYSAYECADGKWLSVAAVEIKFWNNICDLVERPDWKRDNPLELMNNQFPKKEVENLFKTKTRDAWMEIFQGKDVCIAPILELNELENHPYHKGKNLGYRQAGNFEKFKTEKGTELKTIGLPFRVT